MLAHGHGGFLEVLKFQGGKRTYLGEAISYAEPLHFVLDIDRAEIKTGFKAQSVDKAAVFVDCVLKTGHYERY